MSTGAQCFFVKHQRLGPLIWDKYMSDACLVPSLSCHPHSLQATHTCSSVHLLQHWMARSTHSFWSHSYHLVRKTCSSAATQDGDPWQWPSYWFWELEVGSGRWGPLTPELCLWLLLHVSLGFILAGCTPIFSAYPTLNLTCAIPAKPRGMLGCSSLILGAHNGFSPFLTQWFHSMLIGMVASSVGVGAYSHKVI